MVMNVALALAATGYALQGPLPRSAGRSAVVRMASGGGDLESFVAAPTHDNDDDDDDDDDHHHHQGLLRVVVAAAAAAAAAAAVCRSHAL